MTREPLTSTASSLGARIRQFREAQNLTQEQLGDLVGIHHRQTIGQLESGARTVRVAELVRIAQVLHVDLTTLLENSGRPVPAVLWRSAPEAEREALQADFVRWCERHGRVLRLLGRDCPDRLPRYSVNMASLTYRDVSELAREVGALLNLGRRPSAVLQQALQDQYDVLVWFIDTGACGSAACIRGEFGSAILIPRRSVPWRRNFDAAHELFHLLTWDSFHPQESHDESLRKKVETLAESFAAALLMPEQVLQREIESRAVDGKVAVTDVVPLAVEFDVSFAAMMWRLLNLRYLPDADAVRELIADPELQSLDRLLRQRDRGDLPRVPQRFVELAYTAWLTGRLSRTRLAEYLDCTLTSLPRCLEDLGIVERSEADRAAGGFLTVQDFDNDELAEGIGEEEATLCPL